MIYQTQIRTTEPDNWSRATGATPRDAALNALRRVGPSALPCTVYVGMPKPLHDNGAPMIVHAFDLVRAVKNQIERKH